MDISNLSRRDLLIEVAKMYYIEKLSQKEIADAIHLSRSNVSKMLKSCVDQGIVEFRINALSSAGLALQGELERTFGLLKAVIVPSSADPEQTQSSVGEAGARYLESVVRSDMLVGMAWGTTLYYLMRHMRPVPNIHADCIQVMGGVTFKSADTDGQELTRRIARNLGGESYVLQAPMTVQNSLLKDLLMQEERIAQHFERMNHIDVIAMGIGSNKPSFSAIVRAGQINKEESEGLLAAGAVGDICGIQLDALGHVAKTDFSGRIMSIDPDVLLKVPIRIGVAAGSEKLETTLAGLRGGFINVLVMDEVSARRVLRVQEMDPKPVRARS